MKFPSKIAGLDSSVTRDLIKIFCDNRPTLKLENGRPVSISRKLDSEFISKELSVDLHSAERIRQDLTKGGWIGADTLTPTRCGMALAQHVDRPNIARDQALAILEEAVCWAEHINAIPDARITVKSMFLYGSLLREEPTVGDVDLFVSFTTMDLGDDLLPEDMEQEEKLCAELAKISDYLSPASEIDRLMMSDVETEQVFPRS